MPEIELRKIVQDDSSPRLDGDIELDLPLKDALADPEFEKPAHTMIATSFDKDAIDLELGPTPSAEPVNLGSATKKETYPDLDAFLADIETGLETKGQGPELSQNDFEIDIDNEEELEIGADEIEVDADEFSDRPTQHATAEVASALVAKMSKDELSLSMESPSSPAHLLAAIRGEKFDPTQLPAPQVLMVGICRFLAKNGHNPEALVQAIFEAADT